MTTPKRQFGDWGERVAEYFLHRKGYSVIAKNFNTRYGEIDLVSKKGDRFIFIEVKTRANRKYGIPEEAVTSLKQRRLVRAAEIFISANHLENVDWQIDVLAIEGSPNDENIKVRHLKNAVGYD